MGDWGGDVVNGNGVGPLACGGALDICEVALAKDVSRESECPPKASSNEIALIALPFDELSLCCGCVALDPAPKASSKEKGLVSWAVTWPKGDVVETAGAGAGLAPTGGNALFGCDKNALSKALPAEAGAVAGTTTPLPFGTDG